MGIMCEHCCKDLPIDSGNGRPIDPQAKRPLGFRTQPIFATRTVFGTYLCQKCWNDIKRSKPRAAPMNANMKRYITAIESGRKVPPFRMSVTRDGVTDHLPIKLTAKDLKKCGMER